MGEGVKRILITGGAGFIGVNLTRSLLKEDFQITILDNFSPQIHGANGSLPEDLRDKVNLVVGDVTNKNTLYDCLESQNIVVHLAAETGTGQSMYQVEHYCNVNIRATGILCDYLINENHTIENVIVASSRSIYGEGKYFSSKFGPVFPELRAFANSQDGFEVKCPVSGKPNLEVLPTDEESKLSPSSFYGITKQVQEQMILLTAKLINIRGFALRYQNVYGPGQSLQNPYTGILSIFSRLALKNEKIYVFEDGKESRDFVFIDDVIAGTMSCIKFAEKQQHSINIGSGVSTNVLTVANEIVSHLGSLSEIEITGAFRKGDIRHNIADLTHAKNVLNYSPKWDFKAGLHSYLNWVLEQADIPSSLDDYKNSLKELSERGLLNE